MGATLFFEANDGIHGRELWKSDGTSAGTVLVKDIRPGGRGSGYYFHDLTDVGGTLFFTADDGTHGFELWKSDGTKAGTVLVKDLRPGAGSSAPYYLTGVGGTLFFTAIDNVHGRELWKSDGTTAGTVLVKDIRPGEHDGGANSLTGVGGTLFFTDDEGIHGRELWKSDGSRAGTVLVKDIRPGADDSALSSMTGVQGTLFFSADDGIQGGELWKSDGSRAGTVLVKDIRPGALGSGYYALGGPGALAGVGGTLFFTADDGIHGSELWKSNGTRAGTVLVKDIRPGKYSSGAYSAMGVGGTLFLTADDGIHGSELWKSDGTRAGTVLVKDINLVHDDYQRTVPRHLTDVGGTLFFSADDGIHGRELWKSNGTRAGTVLVKDIHPGHDYYYYNGPYYLTGVGGTLLFSADDGIHGSELWKSDGTRTGTVMVRDINARSTCKFATNGKADTRPGPLKVKVAVAAGWKAGGSSSRRVPAEHVGEGRPGLR